jgi:DNA-binding NarL/FixJ family response regulator
MTELRVVVAEDHYLVREGIRRALEASGRIEVVATVSDADELEIVVDHDRVDVIVTDIRMPPDHHTEGIDAAHRIRERHPGIGIVVLSQHADATYAIELLRNGTDGLAYLLKERVGDPRQLLVAIDTVAAGGSVIDPDVVGALVEQTSRQSESAVGTLTPREHDVLHHMAQGRTNAGIALELNVSESSVEKYATSMFAKLGLTDEPLVHRRVAAVLTYLHEAGQARPI